MLTAVYDCFGLNRALFALINQSGSQALDAWMLGASALGNFWNLPWLLALALCLIGLHRHPGAARWLPPRAQIIALTRTLLAGYALVALVVFSLKLGLHLPRPAAALPAGSVRLVAQPESPYSFPSGHSAFAMLLAATLWPVCRWRARLLWLAFALWVGISRISLGVHFPADVLAGWLCGGLGGWASHTLLRARAAEKLPGGGPLR